MFAHLWTRIQGLFEPTSLGSLLETYIINSCPTNEADVDRLTREFYQRQGGGSWQ